MGLQMPDRTLGTSVAGRRGAIGNVIHSKRKIRRERKDDEPLADNQKHVAYAYELDEDYHNCCVPDAHADKRQVMRRLGSVDTFYLKKNINVQSYVGGREVSYGVLKENKSWHSRSDSLHKFAVPRH